MKYRIGVDIGGTTIKAGIIDDEFKILKKEAIKTSQNFNQAMKSIYNLVDDLTRQLGLKIADFSSLGVGVPGYVIPYTGKLLFFNNIDWKDESMTEGLKKYFPMPIYFGNDADCAVIAEKYAGAAQGHRNVVMITLGTGVGGGIIIHDKLFTGGDGMGVELGHIPIVHDGVPCTCGLKGCLEAYASATALIRQTNEALKLHPESSMHEWINAHGDVTGQTAFDCAMSGDKTALNVIDKYISYLASATGGFINLFRPEVIIFGGGISNAGEFLIDRIRKLLPKYTFAYDLIGAPPIKLAASGSDAGIIGAACLEMM